MRIDSKDVCVNIPLAEQQALLPLSINSDNTSCTKVKTCSQQIFTALMYLTPLGLLAAGTACFIAASQYEDRTKFNVWGGMLTFIACLYAAGIACSLKQQHDYGLEI